MTFSYFVLYFHNATQHRYHVIDFLLLTIGGTIWHALQLNWSTLNCLVYGGLSAPRGVCVYFSYGIPETIELVHHGESIGETKTAGRAMSCPACSQVICGGGIKMVFLCLCAKFSKGLKREKNDRERPDDLRKHYSNTYYLPLFLL